MQIPTNVGERVDQMPCCLCDDDDCAEWHEVEVIEGPYSGYRLCHVSECRMLDEQFIYKG
jgi:hypothetical protein